MRQTTTTTTTTHCQTLTTRQLRCAERTKRDDLFIRLPGESISNTMASFGGGVRHSGGYGGQGGGRGRLTPPGGRGGGVGSSNHGAGGEGASLPRLQLCRNFASTGHCHHGVRCNFSHVVRLRASVVVSDPITSDGNGGRHGYNHRGRGGDMTANKFVKSNYRVTSVAVWESSSSPDGSNVKLFTGSYDGKWRLWNLATSVASTQQQSGTLPAHPPSPTLTKEFEHGVGGPVDCFHIAANHFFVGFESSPLDMAPDSRAGMVHGWNLISPNDPPSQLWMSQFAKYAGSGRVRTLCTSEVDGRVWTGGDDGLIREWNYAVSPATGIGGFGLGRTMGGHLGAVTGLALSAGNVLWSVGMDGTIRLWNVETGELAHVIAAVAKDQTKNNGGVGVSVGSEPSSRIVPSSGPGHAGPVMGILPFDLLSSSGCDSGGGSQSSFIFTSSLDETVKVWNATNGKCVASERHGQGVTAIALSTDLRGNPLLLCGLFYGDIMVRGTVSNPPLCLLLKISHNFLGVGHEAGPVNDIQTGPGNTFYAVADDGKLTAWQITGDFGL